MPISQQNQLFELCKSGNAQQVIDALVDCGNESVVDERNNTPLCVALKNGQWKTVEALIEGEYLFVPRQPLVVSASQFKQDDNTGIVLALKIDENVNALNQKKRTALMTACLLGHVNKVHELLNRGADSRLVDCDGTTALMEAVQSRNKKLVEIMLQQKLNINVANRFNETALIIAVKQKTPVDDIIKALLLAGADPELLDVSKKSAWLIAKQKHPKISRIIEKHLNDINQIELPFFGQTAEKETQLLNNTDKDNVDTSEIPEEVLTTEKELEPKMENIASPQITFPQREAELFSNSNETKPAFQEWFHAAKTGNLGRLNRMIIEGIDINCKDNKGCTALIRACGHSRRAVVSFLLQQKAEIEIRSDNGSTALSSSIIGNCRRVAGLLLEKGANSNGLGPADYSYATLAAAQWNDAMLSILHRNGADIFIQNTKRQNLMHVVALAAEYYSNINNAKATCQFLLDHGFDINDQDENGNTALMLVCGVHKKEYKADDRNIAAIVHALLKMGAAPAITNSRGKSAFDATQLHKLAQSKGVIMNALSWNDGH